MGWTPGQPLPRQVRVVRDWPGGPPLGEVISPSATRREHLLRLGVVEAADDEPPARPPRRRGTVQRPEQADDDLLSMRSVR